MDERGKSRLKEGKKTNHLFKFLRTVLVVSITLGLMIYLVFKVKPNKLADAFRLLDTLTILLVFLLTLLMFVIKTLRWKYILYCLNLSIPFFQLVRLVLIGSFGAVVTPAKIGDVVRAHYLSRWNDVKDTTSYFSVILDRVMDLISIGIFSLIALPFFITQFQTLTKWAFSIGIFLITIVLVVVFNSKIVRATLALFMKLRSRRKKNDYSTQENKPKSMELVDNYYSHLAIFNSRTYTVLILMSLLFWILLGLQVGLLICSMSSLSIQLSVFLTTTGIMAIAAIVSLTPISVSGIGIRDVTFTFLMFYSLEVAQEIGLSTSIIQTSINMVIPALMGGILLLLTKLVQNKKKR